METGEYQNLRAGLLTVRVYASTLFHPAAGAVVRIQSSSDERTLETLVADLAGRTAVIELPAPQIALSLEPQTEIRPYAEYDIVIEAAGMQRTRVKGVQVFSGVTAEQTVVLQAEIPDQPQAYDVYVIPPHTLWGRFAPKIPEAETKPIPPGAPELPIVPQSIIVHLGEPGDTFAENTQLPFKQYIKNAASCTLYPTWPKESLRAGILALISFALNRIYTKWYPTKGYNYDITNSTFFDPAFAYGRNFYENISSLVDGLFTTYIIRNGADQPLLAQYCSGSPMSCPRWLELWGSTVLAGQGLNALSILRYYYGQNVTLRQADYLAGLTFPFPGKTLTFGMISPAVYALEEQLNKISEHYVQINRILPDGHFGSQTQEAVRTFQSLFGLPVTGEVDLATWYAVQSVYASLNG